MKYVTIRLLVDDHRAARLESGLEITARGEGHMGISVDSDDLFMYDVEDQAAVDGFAVKPGDAA